MKIRSCRVGVRRASCHGARPWRCPMVGWASKRREGRRAGSARRGQRVTRIGHQLVCFDGVGGQSGGAAERRSGARSVARNRRRGGCAAPSSHPWDAVRPCSAHFGATRRCSRWRQRRGLIYVQNWWLSLRGSAFRTATTARCTDTHYRRRAR
jgi:hypothetical protein